MADNETPTKIDTTFEIQGEEIKANENQEVDPNDPNVNPRQGLPETVALEEAAGPMQLARPDPKATGPWIQYNGIGTVRIMDEATWRAAGVDSTKYCQWNGLNKMRLPRSIFNDEELQYLLRVDRRFSLVEE